MDESGISARVLMKDSAPAGVPAVHILSFPTPKKSWEKNGERREQLSFPLPYSYAHPRFHYAPPHPR
jgi:hypothetical protein